MEGAKSIMSNIAPLTKDNSKKYAIRNKKAAKEF